MKESKLISAIFIITLILALLGGVLYFTQGYNIKNQLAGLINLGSSDQDTDSMSLTQLIWQTAGFEQEKNYLLLFQNNMELRPSGGFIGNIGFLKIKNGQVQYFASHDTTIYDGYGQAQTEPPAPLRKYLGLANWQSRDANWSADFPTAAQKTEELYWLVGGLEDGPAQFDGVIAINAAILPALLDYTGPLTLDKYAITFNKDNVLYDLEYEVEKGYVDRGLEAGDRKLMFKELLAVVMDKLTSKNLFKLTKLKDVLISQLNQKNIQVYFKDESLQQEVSKRGWAGQVYQETSSDYLMLVEANLDARKSNYYVKRSLDYTVDLDKEKPLVNLKISYEHQGHYNDWFNHDYLCYLRVYVPQDSWLLGAKGFEDDSSFETDLNKKVFGHWLVVPTNSGKSVELTYELPAEFKDKPYQLLVQKQSGVDQIPIKVRIIHNGKVHLKEAAIVEDWQGAILLDL